MYQKYIKRILDFVLSLIAIICLSPVYLIVAIVVRAKLGSAVLFTQLGPGKDCKVFKMYKFRTMTDERDAEGNLLPDEMRLTHFGWVLRSTSLDELPELFNILKGNMSIVGPRPLLSRDVEVMDEEQMQRHQVLPGLTGLAQCSGRNLLNWDIKLAKDIEYAKNISFKLDFYILIQTIKKVVKREGVAFESGTDMDLKDWNALKKKESKGN